MKKNIILLGALIISGVAYSQVGIDTDQPKATLDIKASPTSTTKIDGLIAPRLKGSELKANDSKYTSDQDGAIVYITEPLALANTSTKTINVTSIGYYYFDKTLNSGNGQWVKLANNNGGVYTASNGLTMTANNSKLGGTLTENTLITEGANTLTFSTTTTGGNKFLSNGTTAIPKSAVQIVDGSQGVDKVLTSDSDGNAIWKNMSTVINNNTTIIGASNVYGILSSSSGTSITTQSLTYVNAYIDLPPGKWAVFAGSNVEFNDVISSVGSIWVTMYLNDTSTNPAFGTSDYVASASGTDLGGQTFSTGTLKGFIGGSQVINNSLSTTKRYYLWVYPGEFYGSFSYGTATSSRYITRIFGSDSWERYFYAIKLKD